MYRQILLSIFIILAGPAQAMAGAVVIKLGTSAPEGSVWHDALLEVRQEWSNITKGEVGTRTLTDSTTSKTLRPPSLEA